MHNNNLIKQDSEIMQDSLLINSIDKQSNNEFNTNAKQNKINFTNSSTIHDHSTNLNKTNINISSDQK